MNQNFFNLSKRKKRDVLLELLTGQSSEGMISKKELNALHKLISGSPQLSSINKKQLKKTKKIAVGNKKKETKKRTTHLSENVFKNLESLNREIRALLPEDIRSGFSDSQIINQALTLIINEFKAKGKKSSLVRNIIKKN